VNHRVHDLAIAEPVAGARLRQEVRAVRHRFHAAGHDDFGFASCTACAASATAFSPEPHTLLMVIAATRGAQPPLRAAWRAGFWPRPACTTLPGWLRRFAWAPDRAADGFRDSFRGQVNGGEAGESALKFSDGGADAERITGVPWKASVANNIISDAGGRRFASEKQRHNAEATEARTRRTQRRRRDNRDAEKREGTTWLRPPRARTKCASSQRWPRRCLFVGAGAVKPGTAISSKRK